MKYVNAAAVVTGASSGIGAEFAKQLAHRGAELVLVARDQERLQTVARRLEDHGSRRVTPIALDLSEPGAARRLVAELAERRIAPTMLVNNAGFGTTQAFVETDPDALSRQIALNVTGRRADSRPPPRPRRRQGRGACQRREPVRLPAAPADGRLRREQGVRSELHRGAQR
jgi:short-subunit dehydrogenase